MSEKKTKKRQNVPTTEDIKYLGDMLNLSQIQIHFLDTLRYRMKDHSYCWPSQKTLAEDMRVSKRTIKRLVRELRNRGIITAKRRKIADNEAFYYAFIFPWTDKTLKGNPRPKRKERLPYTTIRTDGSTITTHENGSITTTPPPPNWNDKKVSPLEDKLSPEGDNESPEGDNVSPLEGTTCPPLGDNVTPHRGQRVPPYILKRKEREKESVNQKQSNLTDGKIFSNSSKDKGPGEKQPGKRYLKRGIFMGEVTEKNFSMHFEPYADRDDLDTPFIQEWKEKQINAWIKQFEEKYWSEKEPMKGGMKRLIRRAARDGLLEKEPFNCKFYSPEQERADLERGEKESEDRRKESEKNRQRDAKAQKNLSRLTDYLQEHWDLVEKLEARGLVAISNAPEQVTVLDYNKVLKELRQMREEGIEV